MFIAYPGDSTETETQKQLRENQNQSKVHTKTLKYPIGRKDYLKSRFIVLPSDGGFLAVDSPVTEGKFYTCPKVSRTQK
jgi:hypothetical protein